MATGVNLTDMEVCYKAFRREIIQKIKIEENRFGFEPEITAKVARLKVRIYEVAISYNGRTYAEGQKNRLARRLPCLVVHFQIQFPLTAHARRHRHLDLVLQ
jgi:hypothetical protein